MYKAPPNDDVRLLVIHMQGPLWSVLTFVVHTADLSDVIFEKFTVCKWLKKMEQISVDGSSPPRLDIQELHMQFGEHSISFIIDLGRMNHGTQSVNSVVEN